MSSYGLWLSAAGMKISEHRQTLHANNLANAQTTGFKRDMAVVIQRRIESSEDGAGAEYSHPVLDGLSGGVNVRPAYHDLTQGPIDNTGRPLDLAIRGDGFLTVSDGESMRYTRDGQLTVNTAGELSLANESGVWRVLDQGGAPIVVDPVGGEPIISGDGTVRQGANLIAQLELVSPTNKDALRKVGENLFESTDGEMRPADGVLVSGAREESNFNAIEGLASMIEASRAYQLNATMIQLADSMTGQAVSTLGRVA